MNHIKPSKEQTKDHHHRTLCPSDILANEPIAKTLCFTQPATTRRQLRLTGQKDLKPVSSQTLPSPLKPRKSL